MGIIQIHTHTQIIVAKQFRFKSTTGWRSITDFGGLWLSIFHHFPRLTCWGPPLSYHGYFWIPCPRPYMSNKWFANYWNNSPLSRIKILTTFLHKLFNNGWISMEQAMQSTLLCLLFYPHMFVLSITQTGHAYNISEELLQGTLNHQVLRRHWHPSCMVLPFLPLYSTFVYGCQFWILIHTNYIR